MIKIPFWMQTFSETEIFLSEARHHFILVLVKVTQKQFEIHAYGMKITILFTLTIIYMIN